MYTLTIPAPDQWINANDRTHRMAVARLTKAWRNAAYWAAKDARLPVIREHVRVTASVHKLHGRQYDATNWAPTAKACVDGLRDAGVLLDDSNKYVTGPDMRPGERATGRAYLVLNLEPTGVAL
ncbi:hypothetical protein [Janibacter terrae]|uniref:hypothetical protein n=1 Tax=Janibacter terrae TaxID=103817 RepID=UPI0031F84E0C